MSSQPLEIRDDSDDSDDFKSGTQSADPLIQKPIRQGFISTTEAEGKRQNLEVFLEEIRLKNQGFLEGEDFLEGEEDEEDNSFQEEIEFDTDTGAKIYILYFIGRCNPPHEFHLRCIFELVKKAKNLGAKALILLGSGPKKDRELNDITFEGSFADPLNFVIKSDFIHKKLLENGFVLNTDYVIKEMKNAMSDVPEYARETIEKITHNVSITKVDVKIQQFAGNKDGDATKLSSVGNSALSAVKEGIDVEVEGEVLLAHAVEPGLEPLGATDIRKFAYVCALEKNLEKDEFGNWLGFDVWEQKYGTFYNTEAYTIFNGIMTPVEDYLLYKGIPKDHVINILTTYINTKKLPTPSSLQKVMKESFKKKKKGGSKRRPRKGGSKRKPNKTQKRRPNKTQKRRKRRTRRRR